MAPDVQDEKPAAKPAAKKAAKKAESSDDDDDDSDDDDDEDSDEEMEDAKPAAKKAAAKRKADSDEEEEEVRARACKPEACMCSGPCQHVLKRAVAAGRPEHAVHQPRGCIRWPFACGMAASELWAYV